MNAIRQTILIDLTVNRLTLREVRPHVLIKSLSTIREHVKLLIEEGYMTAEKSKKGYYLSRSYKLTKKGEQFVKS